ncbi:MAG: cyclase family protein [Sphaerochaetaceae bacterium]|nr:cyclase family protein [Sphaerochaetaceae bacterium]
MRRFIEISGTLENRLWGYYSLPGLEGLIPNVEITPLATVKDDGFFASRISFSTISGTYVESGSHILECGRLLDSYSIRDFIVPYKLLRLPKQEPHALIRKELLERFAVSLSHKDALLIDTGWSGMWNKPGYVLSCPNYAPDAVEWIIDQRVSIFGVDVPCIESSWSEDNEDDKGGLLGELFARGTLLVAPLVNLSEIPIEGTLYCIPLPIKGTSGAPARVFVETE